MELKTLKDIKIKFPLDSLKDKIDGLGLMKDREYIAEKLKETAKEWIEKLEKYDGVSGIHHKENPPKELDEFCCFSDDMGYNTEKLINWINHFFNLEGK